MISPLYNSLQPIASPGRDSAKYKGLVKTWWNSGTLWWIHSAPCKETSLSWEEGMRSKECEERRRGRPWEKETEGNSRYFNINRKIWSPSPAVICPVSKMGPAHQCFSVQVFLRLSHLGGHWHTAVNSWSVPIWSLDNLLVSTRMNERLVSEQIG